LIFHQPDGYFAAVPVHPVSKERALPDLIQTAVDNGHLMKSFDLGREYYSICTREDLKNNEAFYQ